MTVLRTQLNATCTFAYSTIPKKNAKGYTVSLTCVEDDPYDMRPLANESIKAALVPLLPPDWARGCA